MTLVDAWDWNGCNYAMISEVVFSYVGEVSLQACPRAGSVAVPVLHAGA